MVHSVRTMDGSLHISDSDPGETPAPSPRPAPFEEHLTSAFSSLRDSLQSLLTTLQVEKATSPEVARRLNLSRNLTWKVSKVLASQDLHEGLQHLPGDAAIDLLLAAAAQRGVPEQRSARSATPAASSAGRQSPSATGPRSTSISTGWQVARRALEQSRNSRSAATRESGAAGEGASPRRSWRRRHRTPICSTPQSWAASSACARLRSCCAGRCSGRTAPRRRLTRSEPARGRGDRPGFVRRTSPPHRRVLLDQDAADPRRSRLARPDVRTHGRARRQHGSVHLLLRLDLPGARSTLRDRRRQNRRVRLARDAALRAPAVRPVRPPGSPVC